MYLLCHDQNDLMRKSGRREQRGQVVSQTRSKALVYARFLHDRGIKNSLKIPIGERITVKELMQELLCCPPQAVWCFSP